MKKHVLLIVALSAFSAIAETTFQKIDTNKDRFISYDEFAAWRTQLVKDPAKTTEKINLGAFKKADKNDDGKISPEEFDAREPVATNKPAILG